MLRGTPIHPPPEEGFLARLSLRASIESVVYQITLYFTMLIKHYISLYYSILYYTELYYTILVGAGGPCVERRLE